MNDERLREQARQRLLSADLAEVLDADLTTVDEVESAIATTRPGTGWLTAAAVLLGVGVLVAVGWLRSSGTLDELQQREFDPIYPWYEQEWPFRVPLHVLRKPQDVDDLPADQHRMTVVLSNGGEPTLEAVLQRTRIDELFLMGGQHGEWQPPWRRVAAHDELRSLLLAGLATQFVPERMRELRRLPDLQTLSLLSISALFDEELAAVVAELPKLRQLTCSSVYVEPSALESLQVLPHLDTLSLSFSGDQDHDPNALLVAAARLRNLRVLLLTADGYVEAESLLALHTMRNLTVLKLGVGLGDEGLATLPPRLQGLSLNDLRSATVVGVRQLRNMKRLRSLSIEPLATEGKRSALCEVLLTLPIEHFEYRDRAPDAELWTTLKQLPKLRRLTLTTRKDDLQEVLDHSAACKTLELLVLSVAALPDPEQLLQLRDHPTLRRVRLVRYRPRTPVPTKDYIETLRKRIGVEFEVR